MSIRIQQFVFASVCFAMAMGLVLAVSSDTEAQSTDEKSAAAQTEQTSQSRAKASAAPKEDSPVNPTILAGPTVEEDAELRDGPRPRPNDRVRIASDDVPFGVWISALRGLGLSPQQSGSIRQIAREFEEQARTFRDSQPEDVKRLMREVRQAREQGLPLPPEAREKLAQIDRDMPQPQPYQERIWALLTKEQQEQMKIKLDEMRSRMGARQRARDTTSSESMMSDSSEGDEQSASGNQPRNRRPQAIRQGWRSWIMMQAPDADSPAQPAATQPAEGGDSKMTGQP